MYVATTKDEGNAADERFSTARLSLTMAFPFQCVVYTFEDPASDGFEILAQKLLELVREPDPQFRV